MDIQKWTHQPLIGDVYGSLRCIDGAEGISPCGQLLRVGHPTSGCFATMGGLLKVTWGTKFAIFGLTAQHVLEDDRDATVDSGSVINSKESVDPSDIALSASPDESENNEFSDDENDSKDEQTTLSRSFATRRDLMDDGTEARGALILCHIGTIVQHGNARSQEPSSQARQEINLVDSESSHQLNWALVSIADSSKYETNVAHGPDTMRHLKFALMPAYDICFSREVIVMSGLGGYQNGILKRTSMTLGAMGDEKAAYCLRLVGNQQLQPGDCGSWVADAFTGDICGQVVAVNICSANAIVAPLDKIIDEIKEQLQADTVVFPTSDDLDSYGSYSYPENRNIQNGMNLKYMSSDIHVLDMSETPVDHSSSPVFDSEEFVMLPARSSCHNYKSGPPILTDLLTNLKPSNHQLGAMSPPESPSDHKDREINDYHNSPSVTNMSDLCHFSTASPLRPSSKHIPSYVSDCSCAPRARDKVELRLITSHNEEEKNDEWEEECITCPVLGCPKAAVGTMSTDLGQLAQHLRLEHN